MDYIKIEYSNSCDAFDILYHKKFKNIIYLDTDVGKPEYVVEEEGGENADGEFVPTFQKWKKVYKIQDLYVQEYMVDALKLMEIHDSIFVTLKNDETSKVSDVKVTEEWDETIPCWANVTIEFTVDYYTKTNCCDNEDECCAEARYAYEAALDYDDGGAGQAVWEAPATYSGKYYFFYDDHTGGTYTGDSMGIYKSVDGAWVLQDMESYEYAGASGGTYVDLMKFGNLFLDVPYLANVYDQAGAGEVCIYGFAACDTVTFIQLQYYSVGGWVDVGDPIYDYQFNGGSSLACYVIDTGLSGTYTFRVKWYTHGCVMGYSNSVSETVT